MNEDKGRGRYSKVSRRIWNSQSFKELSQPKPSAAWLFIRLLTGPELSNIPGLFQAWDAGLARSLKWSPKAFEDAFTELSAEGLAKADWEVGLVWLPKAIVHNEPESPNVVVSWRTAWQELPECQLKEEARAILEEWAKSKGPPWAEALAKAFGKPSPKPSEKPSPKPLPNQIQEQKQKQEQRQEQIPQTPKGASEAPAAAASEVSAVHEKPEKPFSLSSALKFPIADRAGFADLDHSAANYLEPQKWPEIQQIAAKFADVFRIPMLRLGQFSRDAGVRSVVSLLAAGYPVAELERAIEVLPRDSWWTTAAKPRGLSDLSHEVVRRALNNLQGGDHSSGGGGPKLSREAQREIEQMKRAAALSRGEVEL